MTDNLSPQIRDAYNLLFDCYNQWAYETSKGLWNGGLSTLEDLELMLGIESPIKREELWKLRDKALTVEDERCPDCGFDFCHCPTVEDEPKDAIEIIKSIEYIDVSDYFEEETKWKHCPECGYKEPDGHWKTCTIGLFLEQLPPQED